METTIHQIEDPTFEKVWSMFQETGKQLQEVRQMFKETDKKFQETDRMLKETDEKFKESDKKSKMLEELFTSKWSKLRDMLVEWNLIKLLNKRGIPVYFSGSRVRGVYQKQQFVYDIITGNSSEIVVVEVKTTLRPKDVKHFLEKLKDFKLKLPKYNDNIIMGAVAYLTEDGNASIMAQNKGLYVIKATGSSASIVNNEDFIPKVW